MKNKINNKNKIITKTNKLNKIKIKIKMSKVLVSNTNNLFEISKEVSERFKEINKGKNQLWRWILIKENENKNELSVIECCPYSTPLFESNEKLNLLLDDQNPSWIIYSVPYLTINGGKREKLIQINWIPDSIKRETFKESAKVKMHAVAQSGKIKKIVEGVPFMYQANSRNDLEFDLLLSKVSRFERDPILPPEDLKPINKLN